MIKVVLAIVLKLEKIMIRKQNNTIYMTTSPVTQGNTWEKNDISHAGTIQFM
jgi:hypothetical protein